MILFTEKASGSYSYTEITHFEVERKTVRYTLTDDRTTNIAFKDYTHIAVMLSHEETQTVFKC